MSVPVHHATASTLVGRDGPTAALLDQFKRAEGGRGAFVLIRGDGGIGKSRLAAEVLHRTGRMGALGLTGHATQFDRGVPFALARAIIGDLPSGVSDAVTRHAAALQSLLDVTTPDRLFAGAEPASQTVIRREDVPRDVLSAMFDLVTQLAEIDTVVMVWEDLHEADSDSVALLMRLARLIAHSRVLVIATTRPRSRAGDRRTRTPRRAARTGGSWPDDRSRATRSVRRPGAGR